MEEVSDELSGKLAEKSKMLSGDVNDERNCSRLSSIGKASTVQDRSADGSVTSSACG